MVTGKGVTEVEVSDQASVDKGRRFGRARVAGADHTSARGGGHGGGGNGHADVGGWAAVNESEGSQRAAQRVDKTIVGTLSDIRGEVFVAQLGREVSDPFEPLVHLMLLECVRVTIDAATKR